MNKKLIYSNNIKNNNTIQSNIIKLIRHKFNINSPLDEFELFTNKYSNIEYFGNGAFGLVFKVFDKQSEVWRVVKKLDINNVVKYLPLEEYIEVIQRIKSINSPYISSIVDRLYFMDGYLFLVMKKENYGDLKSFLIDRNYECMTERASKYVIEDALLALKDLYSLRLFHRDVQPKNFVVAGFDEFDGNSYKQNKCLDLKVYIKLIDFDFVDFMDKPKHKRIGPAHYMSPQVSLELPYTNPDVFSLSMMWYKLLTGHFMMESNADYTAAIKNQSLFVEKRREAFNTKYWKDIAYQPNINVDKSLIMAMSAYDEQQRPQPNQILSNHYINKQSHIINKDTNNINYIKQDSNEILSIPKSLLLGQNLPEPGKGLNTYNLNKLKYKH